MNKKLHNQFQLEMTHPKSERVVQIQAALTCSGCPESELENATVECLQAMIAHWERGYRVHGLWKRTACPDCDGTGQDDPPPGQPHGICPRCNGKGMYMQRLAFVSIPPKCTGGAKVNGYHWEVSDGQFGVEKTLNKAKLACEQLLQGEL